MPLAILSLLLGLTGSFLAPNTVAADACEEWVAKAESVQGRVQVRRAGEPQWTLVQRRDTFCPGDLIQVQERSRVAIVARNEAVYRLDENTIITLTEPEPQQTLWLNLRRGAAYFFSRVPRSLKVITPFLNAGVEGTEFLVKVEGEQTFLAVFEGRVTATNAAGSLTVASGQSAIAAVGQAPALRVIVRPRDAVQWALHYPPIVDFRPADFPGEAWQVMMRQSISFYRQGDLPSAFDSLTAAPTDVRDPRFFTYRAALLLTVGRVDGARMDIERALQLDPRNSHAVALQSIMAVVQNRKDEALRLAQQSVELEPASSAARVALSYAQQARFDLQEALVSLEEAVQFPPDNALAWARLAELRLSVGELKKALQAAQQAVALNPQVARTQTVLGFAYLTQIKIRDAKKAFEQAIDLDQTAPLPRLGMGLAQIRQGKLKEGRGEIAIAAGLDPNNSLIRSYLGKAYFEEKRDKLALNQFATAKELDPQDPTPWFYDAIRKQTVNRPIEALHDLQKSIELNDNRAVYRSRLLLDEDLAARSATLGRIYNDLGFQQRALVEGWKSLNADPGNYSAHRFLADSYAVLPRHEIARVSELLQSQLLQPINITPVPPQFAEGDLLILQGAGPASLSFNEFNPLFNRNRFALQASGIAGGNNTIGDELVHSGLWGRISYSIGQFHHETDGFRENNDLQKDFYNMFVQASLSHATSIQGEFRFTDTEQGDLTQRFNPDNFSPDLRQERETKILRTGFRHMFSPSSNIIASFNYLDSDSKTNDRFFDISIDTNGYSIEAQHIFRSKRFNIVSGVGHFQSNIKNVRRISEISPIVREGDIRHTNIYTYLQFNYLRNVTLTVGGSVDLFEDPLLMVDRDQFNPKFGLTWKPGRGTTLRATVFRVLKRTLISNQTVEPTQVAGFNQFFDDGNGTDSWRYGFAIDQKFSTYFYGGFEFSKRALNVPFIDSSLDKAPKADWKEYSGRAYLYWTPRLWLALSTEYLYESFKRESEFVGSENFLKVETHRVPIGVSLYSPSGFIAQLTSTYINQDGRFQPIRAPLGAFDAGSDEFWVIDAAIGYRLPKRRGLITIGAKNVLDENFNFQSTDPDSLLIQPDRLIFARITLSFQ